MSESPYLERARKWLGIHGGRPQDAKCLAAEFEAVAKEAKEQVSGVRSQVSDKPQLRKEK